MEACLLFLYTVYGQAPVVTIDHSDPQANNKWYITAERDQDVVMDCHVENLDPHTVVSLQCLVSWNVSFC